MDAVHERSDTWGMMFRSLVFTAVFYLNTALFLVVGSPLLLAPRRYAMMGLRAHARASLWLMRSIVGTRYEVRGRGRLPPGPVLVAAKHQSAWDTFALIPLFRDPAMVMKAELGLVPLYGWFSRKFDHVFVQRERGPAALRHMVREARARAESGREIVVFPEGTRRAPGAAPDYKPGVAALYEGLGVPCVPVALNSGMFWPRGGGGFRAGTIVIEILDPIPPGLPRAEFRERLIGAVEEASNRLIEEARASMHGSHEQMFSFFRRQLHKSH